MIPPEGLDARVNSKHDTVSVLTLLHWLINEQLVHIQ